MNARETVVTRVVKSRAFALLVMAAALVAAVAGGAARPVPEYGGMPGGMFRTSVLDPDAVLPVCAALDILAVVMMAMLNGVYNLLRTTSWLFLAMFMVMQAASPGVSMHSVCGMLMVPAVLGAVWLCYSLYQNPGDTKRVFLAFFIISVSCCCHYAYVLYVGVFLAGLVQMRALSLRSLLAAVTGLATPVWLLWAFGIVDFADIPAVSWTIPSMEFISHNLPLAATAGFTLVSGLVIMCANMVKVYGYNAVTRAHNGLLALVWMSAALLCVADFTSAWCVLPLLNCATAFQTGLFFRIYTQQRAYLPVIVMIAVYTALFVWSVWI